MKKMNHSWTVRTLAVVLTAAAATLPVRKVLGASVVSKLSYDAGVLRVEGDGPFTFTQENNDAEKQIVFELSGVTLGESANQAIDASATPGKVKSVTAYPVDGQPETVRVVVQLNEMVTTQAVLDGTSLVLNVPNDDVPAAVAAAEVSLQPPVPEEPAAMTETAIPAAPEAPKDSLASFMETQETGRFVGSPITIQVRDAEIVDVLRLISEASGFNIVIGDDVAGKISLSLVDVPWDQALDVILHTRKLGAERNNNLLRIVTLAALKSEKEAQYQAKRASESATPRVTQIFHINYADLGSLAAILGQVGSSNVSNALAASGSAAATPSGPAGNIQTDARTHTIIAQDTPDNIDRMKKLIAVLDTQTPQVLIEAKIVEASESFSKSLDGAMGLSSGIAAGSGLPLFANFNGSPTMDVTTQNLLGSAPRGSQGGAFGLSPNFNILGGSRLNAFLSFTESEGQSKTVLSPRVTILNNTEGSITQSVPVTVRVPTQSNTGAGWQNVDASLQLSVTPHVTNDGSISMQLRISANEPQQTGTGDFGVASKSIVTQVIVDSGNTLVIGGVYKMSTATESSGVPILRNIPLIGWLFGSESTGTKRNELFIFITPRILNEKSAGITG